MDHGGVNHGFAVLRQSLVIDHEPAVPDKPPECPLDHPTTGLDDKTLGGFGRDRNRPTTELPHKILESLGESTIGDDLTHSGQQVADVPQKPTPTIPILDVGRGYQQRPHHPQRINADKAFATRDFFSSVVTLGSAAMSRLDALAVHPQRFWRWRSTSFDADFLSQQSVDFFPSAIGSPVTEFAVNGLPGWDVVGQHPPGSASAEVVEDRVHNTPQINCWGSATFGSASFGFRKERFELLPLLI